MNTHIQKTLWEQITINNILTSRESIRDTKLSNLLFLTKDMVLDKKDVTYVKFLLNGMIQPLGLRY